MHIYLYIHIYIYIYIHIINTNIYTVPFYVNIYTRKTATSVSLLQTENENGKQKFVFLGQQTINGNRRLLFQHTVRALLCLLLRTWQMYKKSNIFEIRIENILGCLPGAQMGTSGQTTLKVVWPFAIFSFYGNFSHLEKIVLQSKSSLCLLVEVSVFLTVVERDSRIIYSNSMMCKFLQ